MRKFVTRAIVLVVVLTYTTFAKPKKQTYDYPASQVFAAALHAAREHHVVTYVDEKNLLFTFETGTSWVSYGFNANASVESDGPNKGTLIINVQKKNVGKSTSFAWGAGDRMANKFFKEVTEELKKEPVQATATATPPEQSTSPKPATSGEIGTIDVSSDPRGAEVDVDGAFVGDTPASLKLPSGKHAISVSKKGFKPWSRNVLVLAGSDTKLDVSLSNN